MIVEAYKLLATSYLTPTGARSCFLFHKQPCRKTSRGRGKDVSVFEKGQIICMHQAE